MDRRLLTQLQRARVAARALAALSTSKKNAILLDIADALERSTGAIIRANQADFARLPNAYALADRLRLDEKRIHALAVSTRAVRQLADPVGIMLETTTRPNGLRISRITTPIGVIGMIYEARPNVTVEVATLTLKSGNAVLLKGGRDASETNRALVGIIRRVLRRHRIPEDAVSLIDSHSRTIVRQLMTANGYVDVLIPRGSERLIAAVRKTATVPTIETGAGVCHTYIERTARLAWATAIVVNAKTRRPSVCNALDTLLVDRAIAGRLIRTVSTPLADRGVTLHADPASYRFLQQRYPKQLLRHAQPKDFGHEFLSLHAAVKVVRDWREALAHMQRYTSGHSEGIVTSNQSVARAFVDQIDAAAVYVNAPTSFTDGFEFGLGAEIGISTQKLHARGPMGLRELTTYKWIVRGQGQIRPA